MSGKFRITCPDPYGNDLAQNPITTNDIKWNDGDRWVSEAIFRNCSNTYDKIEAWRANTHYYRHNGVAFYVRFIGRNGNNTQMKIISSPDDPLSPDVELVYN
jgi:hypothetical protein